MRRWSLLVPLVAILAVPTAAAAQTAQTAQTAEPAQATVAEVAEALRQDPVHVDPSAERALTAAEADELRTAIRAQREAIFVAVLPASMAPSVADAEQLVRELVEATGLSGTFAVIVGDRFRATSTTFANADEVASAAFQRAKDDGAAAVLTEFVSRVGIDGARGGNPNANPPVAGAERDTGDDGSSAVPLALLAAGGGGLYLWSRRRRRQEAARAEAAMASDRQMLRAELAVLADDVMRLESQVAIHPDARTDYEAGVERYRVAGAALDYADEPVDLVRVQRVIDESRYAMNRARAVVEGREPPPPPADLRQPGRHDEPALDLDERGTPYYVGAGPFYGGGWFGGGGGGLFSGLLLGSMLGGFGGWGWGHNHIEINDGVYGGGWGDGGGWSDAGIGGGDWGGDLGGGDW